LEASIISLKELRLFCKKIYGVDDSFKDNKAGIIKIVCGKNRHFYKNSKQTIISVKRNGEILCACVAIIHKNAPEMLSIAFFEALPDCREAVDMLMEHCQGWGRENKCAKMVISLDGHVNNGVAFPVGGGFPSFGESYCPKYYHDYFENFSKIKLTSFYDDAKRVKAQMQRDLPQIEKIRGKISLEYADFGWGFGKTMERYTDLNNRIFPGHKYYFPREYKEDYDLFADMRPLLKNENLIFAKCEGEYVGFILWYPDFNELVPSGQGASVLTFFRYKILRRNPEAVKVVEIGVDRKFRRYGTIAALFNAALEATGKSTRKILSSWILDENIKSKAITMRYITKRYKDYYAYEKEI